MLVSLSRVNLTRTEQQDEKFVFGMPVSSSLRACTAKSGGTTMNKLQEAFLRYMNADETKVTAREIFR
ncbi:hypothetical protein ABTF07_20125, partial [Acinetobacter baumannii]